ncbi:FKBP-type peptidyl-prolyl cis-trans isomerase [Acetobacteraceae bacterium KSS8]|uniref:Peptidyl-prolyl cis-trans isomerase n=1 Tax=Endosaccharibacter trunci TaxID=2812733 RepID=A0ABT1W376_9PROT|nr:FKBP-type peptidyl-prolyl cis-trans isomerase [Acetobacteraceae bacterium KSS8]
MSIRRTSLTVLLLGALGFGAAEAKPAPLTPAEQAQAFLKQKASEPGVVTLPSGLEYKVEESGDKTGPHPTATDSVMVNYVGKLSDGATFDDSKGQIVTLPLDQVIKGWTEGLQLMRPGDVWTFYVPPNLAYGAKGAGPIPPDAALVFRIELVAVSGRG